MLKVEIKVKGNIDQQWSEWLGGLKIHYADDDETILAGCMADQSALYGVIARLRDLGLQLLSVTSEATPNDLNPGSDEIEGNEGI